MSDTIFTSNADSFFEDFEQKVIINQETLEKKDSTDQFSLIKAQYRSKGNTQICKSLEKVFQMCNNIETIKKPKLEQVPQKNNDGSVSERPKSLDRQQSASLHQAKLMTEELTKQSHTYLAAKQNLSKVIQSNRLKSYLSCHQHNLSYIEEKGKVLDQQGRQQSKEKFNQLKINVDELSQNKFAKDSNKNFEDQRQKIYSQHIDTKNNQTISLVAMLKLRSKHKEKKESSKSYGQIKTQPMIQNQIPEKSQKENNSFYQNICKTLQDEIAKREIKKSFDKPITYRNVSPSIQGPQPFNTNKNEQNDKNINQFANLYFGIKQKRNIENKSRNKYTSFINEFQNKSRNKSINNTIQNISQIVQPRKNASIYLNFQDFKNCLQTNQSRLY